MHFYSCVPKTQFCSKEQSQGQEEKVANETIAPEVQNSNKPRNFVFEFSLPSILEGLLVQIGVEIQ